jgi:hypothetical protein
MKYVGITAALAIACLLVMPALSMPDQDNCNKMDSKFDVAQAMCKQHQICPPCQEPKGPAGDGDREQACPCKEDGKKFGPESMKKDKECCDKHIKSMMPDNKWKGNECCHKHVKSMMDGKCQWPMGQKGDECKQQMTQCQTQCQNKEWGQKEQKGEDGKQMTECQNKELAKKVCPKSMMDGKEKECKPIKSMMGDEKKGEGKGEKEEIAIFMLIRQ